MFLNNWILKIKLTFYATTFPRQFFSAIKMYYLIKRYNVVLLLLLKVTSIDMDVLKNGLLPSADLLDAFHKSE